MKQKPAIRHILLFENRDIPGMRIAAELQKFADSFSLQVTKVADLAGIRRVLHNQSYAAIIIEVGRIMGDALAALRYLGKEDLRTPLFVYNGFMLPKIAEKSLEYLQVQYLENHANFSRLITMILDELNRKKKGTLHGIALANFLQLMSREKFAGEIIVTTGEKRGVLSLRSGQLISADTNGSRMGTALAEMSGWEKVSVEIREEPLFKGSGAEPSPKTAPPAAPKFSMSSMDHESGTGRIDILRIRQNGKTIAVELKKLQAALPKIQEMLADVLVRMDIFLSANGHSLAGWNSHTLACSAFAAITRSIRRSLQKSSFPQLQHYYLIDLADEHMVLILNHDELQWGFLLKGANRQLGLLLNVVMPEALNVLAEALMKDTGSRRNHGENTGADL